MQYANITKVLNNFYLEQLGNFLYQYFNWKNYSPYDAPNTLPITLQKYTLQVSLAFGLGGKRKEKLPILVN